MTKFFTILFVMLFSLTANAALQRFYQDAKLPTQAMLEHLSVANPAAASATLLTNAGAATNGSATTFSSFSAQPDFPRNIVITTGGTTANVGAGTAVVSGTNYFGKAISENFTISSAQNGATTGSKAFKSVSSVVFPAATGTGVTVSIGTGVKLGMPRCLDDAGKYVFSEFGGVYDATRGTMAVSASAVESNTFSDNSAPDGAHNVEVFYVQNFKCLP